MSRNCLENSVLLKVNKEPIVKCYLHHAFVNSIISGGIEEKDHIALELSLLGEKRYVWTNHSKMKITNQKIVMEDDKANNYEFIYRECDDVDEIIVHVDKIQNKRANAILNLVITCDDFENNIRNSIRTYKFGIMYNQILTRFEKQFFIHKAFEQKLYKYIKLCRIHNTIQAFISTDSVEWTLVEEVNVDFLDDTCKIGIIAEKLGSDSLQRDYQNWLCMNYIQLYYNEQDQGNVFLDYAMFPVKNCRYDYVYGSNFLDIDYIETSDTEDVFGDCISFINWCLKRGYYPAITLDEYYVKGRRSYQKKHCFHHNMIYGYDCEVQQYSVMGYGTYLINDEISVEDMKKALNKAHGFIMLYKIKKNAQEYQLSLKNLISSFERLLDGNNSSDLYAAILQQQGDYGLDILLKLCHTEQGKNYLFHDKRISYVLYEHCFIMQKRLKFLEMEYSHLGLDELEESCNSMLNCSIRIKNLVLKNQIRECYEDKIIGLMEELYRKEKEFYTSLITKLLGGDKND